MNNILPELTGIPPEESAMPRSGDMGGASGSEFIREVQYYLQALASGNSQYLPVDVSGTLDEQTTEAIRRIQEANGLPITGMIDLATWQILQQLYRAQYIDFLIPVRIQGFPSINTVIRNGNQGDAIRFVQIMINNLAQRFINIPRVPYSGIYDETTEQAVRSLQRIFQLPVTGEVDRLTWDLITREFNRLS